MNVIAVVPCYNEENFIADVIQKASKHVDAVIVVDDGSSDRTSEIATGNGARVIRHNVSMGAGAATRSGIEEAKKLNADIVVTIDGDGQHNPDEIPALLGLLKDNQADVVIGSRFLTRNGNVRKYRKFGIDVITVMCNVFSREGVSDSQSGFRAFNRNAVDQITISDNGFGFSVETLIKARKLRLRIGAAPISCIYHAQGSTLNPLIHGLSVVLSVIKYRIRLMC